MIESKDSALFRSDDGGQSWKRLDASQFMIWRSFYFANLIVDPVNENKVFKTDLQLLLSVNGGTSFSNVANAHGDFHDVWIDPSNPNVIYAGDDGGLWNSEDGGTRWAHQMNLPVSQFYHVSTDSSDPYHVYGGLQDNSSWVGDSSYPNGVTNARWENMLAETASGCSKTRQTRTTYTPRHKAVRLAASTGTRWRCAPSSHFPAMANPSCASTGTRLST